MTEYNAARPVILADEPSGGKVHGAQPVYLVNSNGTRASLAATYPTFSGAKLAGHRLVALGDSITYAGDTPAASQFSDSFSLYLQLMTGGKVRLVANAGVGGNQTSQMLARFDTDVAPYAPTLVSVLGGTNDFTFGVTDEQFRANIVALVAKIRGIGAIPLLYTSPPVNSLPGGDKQRIYRNNAWLAGYGQRQGIVVVDAFSVWVDPASPGNWRAELTRDGGVHPNEAGHAALGRLAAAAVGPLLPPVPFPTSQFAGDPLNLLTNGLFLTDMSGWGQNWGPDSGSINPAIITDSGVPGGRALRFTLTNAVGRYQLHQTVTAGFAPGDRVRLSAVVSNTDGVKAQINVGIAGTGGNPFQAWIRPVDHGLLDLEFTVPDGATGFDVVLFAGNGAGPATGTCDFAAVTLRNLTAANLLTA